MWKYIKRYFIFAVIAAMFMDLLQPEIMQTIVDDGVLGLDGGNTGNMGIIIKYGLLMNFAVLMVLITGNDAVAAGASTPGSIMTAITYSTTLLNGIMMLVLLFQNITRGTASWKRVKQIIECKSEFAPKPARAVRGYILQTANAVVVLWYSLLQ